MSTTVFTNPASSSADQATAYTSAILGLLGEHDPIGVLQATPATLREVLAALSPAALATREKPGKWSVSHVIQHLGDSELVWSYRLRTVLAEDRPPIRGYDQDGWADRLGYDAGDARLALDIFEALRRANLVLLNRVTADDRKRVGIHAERGEESVDRMIGLYAGHDLMHLRQIDRIRSAIGAK